MGLTIKDIAKLIVVSIVMIAMILVFSQFMPILLAVYLSMPVVGIIILSGKKIGNMTVREIIAYMPTYKQLKKGIEYSSTECTNENEEKPLSRGFVGGK